MELNHNYDGKTRLRAWWKQVKANFQAIESHADETDAAIAFEKAERESGDNALQTKLDNEANLRSGKDDVLQAAILNEIDNRTDADAELDGKISAEMTVRSNVDGALDGKITSEKNNRINADNALQSAINTETDNRTQADEVLSQKIEDLRDSVITENKLTELREELYGRVHETATVSVTARTSPYGVHGENIYGEVTSVTSDDPNSPYYHVKFYIEYTDLLGIISVDGVLITKIDQSLEAPTRPGTIYVDDPYWESGAYTLCVTVDPKTQTIIDVIWQKHDDHTINDMCFTEIDGERYITLEVGQIVFNGLENGVGVPVTGDFDLSATWERQNECTDEIGIVGTLDCLPTEDKSSLAAAIGEVNAALDEKVDAVSGKGLSANDYTTADKNKLAGIEENANNYTHPASHSASMIEESEERKFMTSAEKTKLAGVDTEANNYTHPASHPASMITTDSENRFVTDAEKAAWNEFCAGNMNYTILETAINRIDALENAMEYTGDGTEFKPYLISTVVDFERIRSDLTACYRLTNDIEMSGTFEPIGSEETPFTGVLDGAGYTIKNLKINAPDKDCVGLFGVIGDGGVVKELSLNAGSESVIQGKNDVGAVAGENNGTIYKVNTTFSTVHVKGSSDVGGLVGVNYGKIQYSYNRGKATAASETGYAAGIAALNAESGLIEECYSVATLTGNCAGGVAGINKGEIKRSHSTLEIVGDLDNSTGTADSTTTKESLKNMRGPESMTTTYADWSFGTIWNTITGSTQFPTYVKPNNAGKSGSMKHIMYSAVPVQIGTWIDGRAIYRAAWKFSVHASGSSASGSLATYSGIPGAPFGMDEPTVLRDTFSACGTDYSRVFMGMDALKDYYNNADNIGQIVYCIIEYMK